MARYRRFDTSRAGVSTVDTETMPEVIEGARSRRAGLRNAIGTLEYALAAPAPHRVDEWRQGVKEALSALHEVWTRHIVETEAPGAFLDELVTEAPRLSTPTSRLRRDHTDILDTITAEEARLASPPDDDSYTAFAESLRVELTALLAALARHRQRGADLVFEAYAVDLGGG